RANRDHAAGCVTPVISQNSLISSIAQNVLSINPFQQMINEIIKQKIAPLETRMQQLEEMVQDLQERNDCLNYKTNDLAQYQRRCAFHIYGIAENKEGNKNAIIKYIGKVMGVKVEDSDIYASHRLKQNKQGDDC
ncbi:unnamed protein product, partial [Didymodactylos carnosus]